MGYISKAKGEIKYSPALSEQSIFSNEIISKYLHSDYDITVDTDWNSIYCSYDDGFKAYCIVENLTELVSAILQENPSTTFSGYLEIHGEGDGFGDIDLWRLAVKDGKVVEIRPELVWPDA